MWADNPFVRGFVSGIGVLHLIFGVRELVRHRARAQEQRAVNRGARLLWPLFFAAVLGVLHWASREQPGRDRRRRSSTASRSSPIIALPDLHRRWRSSSSARSTTLVFDLFSRRRNVNAPVLLREIVSIFLFLILIAWAASFIFDTKVTAFLAGGTVLAAVLGLALQETLGNLFAGIALHLEDSFEVGDVIRSGEHIGIVEAVRWRGTRLRTFNNNIVIVPNSVLARDAPGDLSAQQPQRPRAADRHRLQRAAGDGARAC